MSTSPQPQLHKTRAFKAAMAMAAAVATGTLLAACGGSQDSAQVSQSPAQPDSRQAGGVENSTSDARKRLEAEKAKAQQELNQLRLKIDKIQYRWDLSRQADPGFKASLKERQDMFTLRASEQNLDFKIKELDRQLKDMNAR